MNRRIQTLLCALFLVLLVGGASASATGTEGPPNTGKESPPSTEQHSPASEEVDLTPRLQELYERRAQRLLTESSAPPLDEDFLQERKTAQWALQHEKGKLKYVQQWASHRGVKIVEAKPTIKVQKLKTTEDRVRFYVAQALQVGYQYPGEDVVNRFGVGSRHIVELHRSGDQWLIGLEWYSDPLGDESETPAPTPGGGRSGKWGAGVLEATGSSVGLAPATVIARRYDREGAVRYADTYCGLAAGCGNDHKYNTRFRNYTGEGGDCSNFVSQALQQGGKLRMPTFTLVESLVSHLRYSGKADLVVKGDFPAVWKVAAGKQNGFRSFLAVGDVLAYQYKGKFAHTALITSFDSRGYPMGNSHTADRYHVPFDLGWDKKTIYWFLRMRD